MTSAINHRQAASLVSWPISGCRDRQLRSLLMLRLVLMLVLMRMSMPALWLWRWIICSGCVVCVSTTDLFGTSLRNLLLLPLGASGQLLLELTKLSLALAK